jgi:cell division protein FtsB
MRTSMNSRKPRPPVATLLLVVTALMLAGYFTFAAVQGDFGVFRQVELAAEKRALIADRDRLAGELAQMQNLTKRMSDTYLDIDLLDVQARDVLGYVRADEIVIR